MTRSIATRTGDEGTTGLLYGQRVPKHHPQIEAVGAFDELNAAIGFAKATCDDVARRAELESIQKNLVSLMGEIACAETDTARFLTSKFSRIGLEDLARVDAAVAVIEAQGVSFEGWATPGGTLHAAALDLARTAGRRAERRLSALPEQGRNVRSEVRQYVNRISDLLWLMARVAESSGHKAP